jgi:glutamate-1-semialdehyde 2,1-aminomutase
MSTSAQSTAPSHHDDMLNAVAQARLAYAASRPRSAALHRRACGSLPNGSTRSTLSYGPFPTAMDRGEGCRLWDIDGHEYLDLCGEFTAGLFGHSETRIHAAIHEAMARGLNRGAVGEAEAELAELLCARFPSCARVRFTNSGTEANLWALTAARAFTGRDTVLVFRGGYHGSVLTFPAAGPSRVTVPFPFVIGEYNDIAGSVALIREHGAHLAAILVEPMLGAGGCIPAQREFLEALRAAATEVGALLIFDEVMTSRMSAGGLQARLGITPDQTVLGKYIAGGMSFGGFGGREDVMNLFESSVFHGGTFNNNVLSMTAGRVAMGEIFTADAADALFDLGEGLRAELNAACAGSGMQFTGVGSMMTVHFRALSIDRPYLPTSREDALRELFFFDMLASHIYIVHRGMVTLSLPVTARDLRRFVEAVQEFTIARRSLLALASWQVERDSGKVA